MGKLLAGAAMRCINPPPEMIDRINADGRYGYTGIADDLFCRVTVLSNGREHFAIIASDLSRFPLPKEFLAEVEEHFGIDEAHLLVGGTRSHNTVSYKKSASYDDFTPGAREYYRYVHQCAMEALEEALSRLVPARIGAAVGESRINAGRGWVTPIGTLESPNHRDRSGTRLRVVKVEALSGEIISVIVNYSMHCILQCWNDTIGEWKQMSGDLGGAVSRFIERWGKHTFPCSWTVGGGADRIPLIFSGLERVDVDDSGRFYFERRVLPITAARILMEQFACEQGMDILHTMESIHTWSEDFAFYSEKTFRDVDSKTGFHEKIAAQRAPDDPDAIRYVPGMDVTPQKGTEPLRYVYRVVILNGIAFAGVNGMPYSENYEKMADAMPTEVTLLFDDCYGTLSSIPVPEEEEKQIYGHSALQSHNYSAREATDAFLDGFRELGERYFAAQ